MNNKGFKLIAILLLGAGILYLANTFYLSNKPKNNFTDNAIETSIAKEEVTLENTKSSNEALTSSVDKGEEVTKNNSLSSNSTLNNSTSELKENKPLKVTRPDGRPKILLPEIILTDKDGKKVSIKSFEGKNIIINVWASWCGPCKSEMPDLLELEGELKEDEALIMVNSPGFNGETKESALSYLDKEGLNFKNLLFGDDPNELMKLQASVIPTSLFVDKEGYVYEFVQGAISKEKFRELLDGAQ